MPKVQLKPLRMTDWTAVHSWAKLPEACRYQPYGPDSEEQTRAFVTAAVNAWNDRPQSWFVYAAHVDGQVLGLGQLDVKAKHRQGELRYVAHPRVWGRGIGTAIGSSLLRIGFEEMDLHRMYGTCDPRNTASATVLKKLGMTFEGRMRHTMLIRDGWRDSELFSILDNEWRGACEADCHRDRTNPHDQLGRWRASLVRARVRVVDACERPLVTGACLV